MRWNWLLVPISTVIFSAALSAVAQFPEAPERPAFSPPPVDPPAPVYPEGQQGNAIAAWEDLNEVTQHPAWAAYYEAREAYWDIIEFAADSGIQLTETERAEWLAAQNAWLDIDVEMTGTWGIGIMDMLAGWSRYDPPQLPTPGGFAPAWPEIDGAYEACYVIFESPATIVNPDYSYAVGSLVQLMGLWPAISDDWPWQPVVADPLTPEQMIYEQQLYDLFDELAIMYTIYGLNPPEFTGIPVGVPILP